MNGNQIIYFFSSIDPFFLISTSNKEVFISISSYLHTLLCIFWKYYNIKWRAIIFVIWNTVFWTIRNMANIWCYLCCLCRLMNANFSERYLSFGVITQLSPRLVRLIKLLMQYPFRIDLSTQPYQSYLILDKNIIKRKQKYFNHFNYLLLYKYLFVDRSILYKEKDL